MKAYWFAFNPSDWLSAKAVRMMSLAERGAYIGLLATAWGEDRPGTLPADEDELRRLAEMSPAEWAVSSRVLLAVFPLADCGTYRYNPRLLEEAGKREELSEKKAEAGRRSAAKRAAASTDGQHNANTNPTGVEINPTGVAQKGNQLQSQLQLQAKAVERTTPPPVKAKSKAHQAADRAAAEGTDTFTAETWDGLNNPERFASICKSLVGLKLPHNLDLDFYRESIKRKVADRSMDVPATTMRNFIEGFFAKLTTAELRTIDAAMPTVPTPMHELPQPKQERPGQIIAIGVAGHDYSQILMKVATYQNHYPTAHIHVIQPR